MKRVPRVWSVVAAGILTSGATAQGRPDFSGAWVAQPARVARGGQGGSGGSLGSGWGSEFTVTQDANHLTVERVFFSRGDLQPALKFRYALDGGETTNVVLMGRGAQEQVSTTAWEGDKLVITTVYPFVNPGNGQPATSEVTYTLSLQRSGMPAWAPSLVIETVRGGALGGPSSTTRTVYTKQ